MYRQSHIGNLSDFRIHTLKEDSKWCRVLVHSFAQAHMLFLLRSQTVSIDFVLWIARNTTATQQYENHYNEYF